VWQVRRDHTSNWRYKIWKQSWPRLASSGVRLYTGEKGGVHVGVAHAELNATEYVRNMRASRAWLSTTGPADLVGTRFFEIFATGTTLCIANRLHNSSAYSSLGIVDGRHALLFSTLSEFEDIVYNYTRRPEYTRARMQIVARAQELAVRRFSWFHVASRIEEQLRCSLRSQVAVHGARGCDAAYMDRHHYHVFHGGWSGGTGRQ